MDFPRNPAVPTHIHSYMSYFDGPSLRLLGATTVGSISWGSANAGVYLPFYLPWPYPIRRVFWVNGGTAAGNSDIGIYTIGGGKIWSAGSTANAGANTPQYVTPSPEILLSPGRYLLAYANDGTTSRVTGTAVTAINGRMLGYYQQASVMPLPASATFAAYNAVGLPLVGITTTTSGF